MGHELFCSSVECTSSVLDALILFKETYPKYRTREIEKCIQDAALFIEKKQNNDGSWYVICLGQ
jgi:achilleol B synthase